MGYGLDLRGKVNREYGRRRRETLGGGEGCNLREGFREYGRRRKETLGGGEGCNLRGVAGKGEMVKSKWVTG